MSETYSALPNQVVSAANGVDYAYRQIGAGSAVPLVLLQHFRGNLDNWDPALIDGLAKTRRVVTFDNVGVGGTTGKTPNSVEEMAQDAIAFLTPQGYLEVFFNRSSTLSQHAGAQTLGRIFGRTKDRGEPTTWETREAQYDAVCAWGIPNHGLLQRLAAIEPPVFVANGDRDPMILPHYSYLIAGLIPQAQLKIYPDSAYGFLFQHHAEFAADIESFLS